MRKLILVITCSLLICSCRRMIMASYKMNRPFEFTSKQEYVDFLVKNLGVDADHIIYPLSGELFSVVNDRGSAIYYGCLKNDSTELVSTELLEQNRDCFGRVISEIKDRVNLPESAMDSLSIKSDFSNYKFRYLVDHRPFALNESPKKLKLVLFYFYVSGTYYYPFYHDIVGLTNLHKDDVDLFLISMDNIGQLQ